MFPAVKESPDNLHFTTSSSYCQVVPQSPHYKKYFLGRTIYVVLTPRKRLVIFHICLIVSLSKKKTKNNSELNILSILCLAKAWYILSLSHRAVLLSKNSSMSYTELEHRSCHCKFLLGCINVQQNISPHRCSINFSFKPKTPSCFMEESF